MSDQKCICTGDYRAICPVHGKPRPRAPEAQGEHRDGHGAHAPHVQAVSGRDEGKELGAEYLIYVPGHFKCTVCGFQLSKQTLSAQSGEIGITENNLVTEACPNDGTMMVKVTWKESCLAASERLTEEFNKRDADISAAQTRACVEQREQDAKIFDDPNWTSLVGTNVANCIRGSKLALSGTTLEKLLAEERAKAYERCANEMENDLLWSENKRNMRKWAAEARTATGGGG